MLTRPEKLVMDYCHVDIYTVQEMEIDTYLFFMREAMIFENSKTEEGREYLKNCWRITVMFSFLPAVYCRFSSLINFTFVSFTSAVVLSISVAVLV